MTKEDLLQSLDKMIILPTDESMNFIKVEKLSGPEDDGSFLLDGKGMEVETEGVLFPSAEFKHFHLRIYAEEVKQNPALLQRKKKEIIIYALEHKLALSMS